MPRIQMHQAIIAAQGAIVFAVQPMQRGFYKIDTARWALRGASAPLRLALFVSAAPEVTENHQHAGFHDGAVDFQRFAESRFGALKVFDAAESFEDPIT